MRRLLQSDHHAATDYDRPNLPWVCGRADEGCPCELGPTARGGCPETPKCRPRRSQRRRRGRLAIGLAIFTAGAVATLVGTPLRREALAPGPLSQAHARLIAGAENRCAACHPGGVESAFVGVPNDAAHATQASLCMECHKTQIDPQHALAAHGLPPGSLGGGQRVEGLVAAVTEAGLVSNLAEGWLSSKHAGHEVACAACHQEHHGAEHDLAAITDARCQACHTERYDHFAKDHPDFGNWPYRRRTRINFDHNSHAAKHYTAAKEAFDCATCHTDGPGGDTKLLAGYEQSCARCHDADIRSSTAGGIAVLQLPMLDRQAIRAAGEDLGPWPAGATGDFDGDLSAIAKLLLAADPAAAAVMNRLGADFSFFDLDPASPDDARDARALAVGIRNLLEGLSTRGHEEIGQRVGRLAPEAKGMMSGDLCGALPIELIDTARRSWFGGRDAVATDVSAVQRAGRQADGGWFVDQATFTLRYVPKGHADPLLRAWIDLAASLGADKLPLREAALAELTDANAAGRCATCHSIETAGNDQLVVNWRAFDASQAPRAFTKFSHRPHLTQPELQDCTHCHQPTPDGARQRSPYHSLQAGDFVSQFQPITKASCTECHQPKAAGASCTQCHNYHVDAAALGIPLDETGD
ncbi:MAG: hypothetical protein AAF589_04655 [Planctomycetota bacterium]